ncbi:MAG: polysaccharide export protein [Proteobacteria bacterium]|nr:polysaccharide export protein [Pseudomonadota bacterium]
MKKTMRVEILVLLFSILNPMNLIDSIDRFDQNRFEQNLVLESLERFERLFNQLNQFNQSNSFAWAQEIEKQPTSRGVRIPKGYLIGQGDVVEVFVWRNEQLSRQVVVRPDGKISLPLIQDIQAEGLGVLQLKDEITRRFEEYLENPRVTVIVLQINSYTVSVLGRVEKPGVYPITGDSTIVEAISMAGGFTEWANKRKITLIREEAGKKRHYRINYKKIESGSDPRHNVILRRGDTIIVP